MPRTRAGDASLGDLMEWKKWRATHANEAFPTDDSFQWFLRSNRQELENEGVYVPRAGNSSALINVRKADVVIPMIIYRIAEQISVSPAA